MCTAAWGNSGDGLWLCFNRDEQRTRGLAETPRLHPGPNGPVAYARDPDGGGTWLAVASSGFAIALLNAYPGNSASVPPGRLSRGQLVRSLAESPSALAAGEQLDGEDLTAYPAFFLLLCEPRSVVGTYWDGTQVSSLDLEDAFWTTSSFSPEAVANWRKDWWRRETGNASIGPDQASALLRQPHPELPAYAATMDRDDARTVSQVQLCLNERGFTYQYRPREVDGLGYGSPVAITWPA